MIATVEWTFPGSTCEAPCLDCLAVQPVSAAINAFTCIALLCASYYHRRDRWLAGTHLSYAAFEFWHCLSHGTPLGTSIHMFAMHTLTYIMGTATTVTLAKRVGLPNSKTLLGRLWRLTLSTALLVDLLVWCFVGGVYIVFTGLFAAMVMLAGPIPLVDFLSMKRFALLAVGVFVLAGVELYEVVFCDEELANLMIPLHAAVEIVGLLLFCLLSVFIAGGRKRNELSEHGSNVAENEKRGSNKIFNAFEGPAACESDLVAEIDQKKNE